MRANIFCAIGTRVLMTVAEDGQSVFLTEKQAARLLSMSHRTLQAWRRIGGGPSFIKLGRAVRYRRRDLIAWIDANTIGAPMVSAS
jgi:predicted DNA-binding transcriptional regulator AlpA